MGSPGARKTHAGKCGETTPLRQRGGRGSPLPYPLIIESEETAFNTLGMQWRGYFDFGVALQEKRAGIKCKGAA